MYQEERRGEGWGWAGEERCDWWREELMQRPGSGGVVLGDVKAVPYGLSLEWEQGSDRGKREGRGGHRTRTGTAFQSPPLPHYGVWTLSRDGGEPLQS